MGPEDNRQILGTLDQRIDALAQRLEALERQDRDLREVVLREVVGSGASEHTLETPQQRPQTTQATEMTVASHNTARGLLLGPRDEQAYSRPLVGIVPSYVIGWLLTCAVAAYGPYIALNIAEGENFIGLGLGAIASLFFGIYAGIRDGRKFVIARFQYVGLITAIGTATVMFLTSYWFVSYFWQPPPGGGVLRWITEDLLFPIGAVAASTWLLFVSGALLGTALQLWTSEEEQGRREGSSSVKVQVWLGFAGTVLAALISLIGTLIVGQ
jgi:hypothetical protein